MPNGRRRFERDGEGAAPQGGTVAKLGRVGGGGLSQSGRASREGREGEERLSSMDGGDAAAPDAASLVRGSEGAPDLRPPAGYSLRLTATPRHASPRLSRSVG